MTLEHECAFNLWWEKYPRHVGKMKAHEKYMKALDNGATVEELDAGIDHYNAWIRQERTPQRYILHAKTWLHGRHWMDEHEIEPAPMWQREYEDWTIEEKQNAHNLLSKGFPPQNMRITSEQAARIMAEFSDNVVRMERIG